MKKIINSFIIFVTIFLSSVASTSENIYYIDMDFIMNNSLAGKSIIKQLKKKEKSYTEKFKKTEIRLKEEETKLISQKNILNKDEFDEKVNLFNQKVSTYANERKSNIENLSQQKKKAQINLNKILIPIITEYSAEKSISYVIPKNAIIIGKSELDITKTILEKLNIKLKKIELK